MRYMRYDNQLKKFHVGSFLSLLYLFSASIVLFHIHSFIQPTTMIFSVGPILGLQNRHIPHSQRVYNLTEETMDKMYILNSLITIWISAPKNVSNIVDYIV